MKARLDYSVRTTRAPGEPADTTVPFIVERLNPVELETIVENCIDRGLIAGLKPTAAHGIAEGVAEQLAREFSLGRSIAFGQYFYGRPYLSGAVGADGRLTAENAVNVRLYKGDAFRLGLGDFNMSFVDGGNTPKIEFVLDNATRTRGEFTAGEGGQIQGSMLYAAGDANKVVFTDAEGAATEVAAFANQGARLLEFTVPALAAGTYSVKAQRIDENGVVRETAAKTVAVKAGAGPVVPEPTITGAKTRGESEGSVNIAGGILDVVGANLETATAVELHSDVQPTGEASLWQTLPATYADGKLTTGELDFDEKPSDGGFVRVETAGGSALYPITYCAH